MNLRSWGHGTIKRGLIVFHIDTSQKSTDSCLISFYLSCISTKKGVMLPHGGGYFTTFNFWKILLNIRKRGQVTVRGGRFFLALIWVKYRIFLNVLFSAYVFWYHLLPTWPIKNCKNSIFKVNFLCQNSTESF